MSASTSTKNPIVFIHGLWLHAESWKEWIEFFRQNGYEGIPASWPGDSDTTKSTRQKPDAVAGYGVSEIADYISGQIKALGRKPILIGHSFGGLLSQKLL